VKREHLAIIALCGVMLGLHLLVIDFPSSSQKVMDEIYYVPAAQLMLNHTIVSPSNVSNLEHPPVAKGFIALGMAILGDDASGWRIFSILFSVLCIPLVWLLSKSLFATTLFSLDTLVFTTGSLGVLDISMLFFSLLGFVLYFRKSYALSGVVFGVALLCKETAIFMLGAVVVYHLLSSEEKAKGFGQILAPAFVVSLVGLQLYDSYFTSFPTVFNHLQYMLSYGATLKGHSWCAYAAVCTDGPYISPFNWLTYYYPPGYDVFRSGKLVIGWRGIATLPVIWIGLAWLLKNFRKPENRFIAVWLFLGFVPYLLLSLLGRVTYPYYSLPLIPLFAIAVSRIKIQVKAGDLTPFFRMGVLMFAALWFVIFYPLF
jgi:predicted membrane-bound dolichyl-phosphate-mannose-protein mannosyltransferase